MATPETATSASTTTPAASKTAAMANEPVVSKTYALDTLKGWAVHLQEMLPAIVVGLIIAILAYFLARFVRNMIERWGRRKGKVDLGRLLGAFAQWVIIATGVMLGLTIIVPTLRPSDLFTSLGVGAVGFGFAFQNILQNWMAGLVLLLRNPFNIGDQITVNGYEGTVEDIEARATLLRTYAGHRVIIPNSVVYTQAVKVNAVNSRRRSDYDFIVPAAASIADLRAKILEAFQAIQDILKDPAPDVLVRAISSDTTTLRVRWWTDSRHVKFRVAHSQVLEQLKIILDEQTEPAKAAAESVSASDNRDLPKQL